jgi:hypothetical protein
MSVLPARLVAPPAVIGRRVGGAVVLVASQIALFMILFQAYKLVRKAFIQRAELVAYDHALQILRWEEGLRLDFELDLQRRVLEHERAIWFFNRYYTYFMWAFYACAIAAMLLTPVHYRRLRRVFIASMVLALPWFALYPLAPPRFMSEYGYPFVDTLAVYGPNYFSNNGLVKANQFAAMPSMHCGWTLIGSVMLAYAVPWKRLGLVAGATHSALMWVTVIVTGNHYVLDIVGGLLVAGLAFAVARALPEELPWPWRRREAGTPSRLSWSRSRATVVAGD